MNAPTDYELHDQGSDALEYRFSLFRGGTVEVLLDVGHVNGSLAADREFAEMIVQALNQHEVLMEALRAAEKAHQVHVKCDDCMEGAADPVSCERCVASWTHAYELRQVALAGTRKAPARNAAKDKDLRDRLTRAKHYLEDADLFGDNQRINKAVGEIVGVLNKLEPRGVETG